MPWRHYSRTDPRRYGTWLRVRLGRRGSFLALLGVVWVLQGVAALTAPESSSYILLAAGEEWRGVAWITTGALAIAYAGRPQGEDAPGFLALYVMAAYRVAAYGLGLLLWLIPGGEPGNARGSIGVLAWAVVIIAILIVAGWRENEEDVRRSAP